MRQWERKPWAEQYRVAILETDAAKLPERIELARTAIWSRLAAVGTRQNRELGPLYDALRMLRLVEGELERQTPQRGQVARRVVAANAAGATG